MKKLIICFVLWGSMLNAQFFESESSEIMENQSAFNTTPIEEPDQGVDAAPNPSDAVFINQYLLLLLISSICIGCYQIKFSKSRVN